VPRSREQVGGVASPWEPRARRRLARGGDQPSNEADLTRGGVRPSSEVEPHPRGCPALERGGTPPEGAASPQARRGFVSVALCPSSEAVFRLRVARSAALVGRWGNQGRGLLPLGHGHF
jgi:hypothetical protein